MNSSSADGGNGHRLFYSEYVNEAFGRRKMREVLLNDGKMTGLSEGKDVDDVDDVDDVYDSTTTTDASSSNDDDSSSSRFTTTSTATATAATITETIRPTGPHGTTCITTTDGGMKKEYSSEPMRCMQLTVIVNSKKRKRSTIASPGGRNSKTIDGTEDLVDGHYHHHDEKGMMMMMNKKNKKGSKAPSDWNVSTCPSCEYLTATATATATATTTTDITTTTTTTITTTTTTTTPIHEARAMETEGPSGGKPRAQHDEACCSTEKEKETTINDKNGGRSASNFTTGRTHSQSANPQKVRYSTRGLSRTLEQVLKTEKSLSISKHSDRLIARMRKYQHNHGRWSNNWTYFSELDSAPMPLGTTTTTTTRIQPSSWTYDLCLGGQLRFLPNVVSAEELTTIRMEISQKAELRQYSIRNYPEPRLHTLYSRTGSDYHYHGVNMKAQPLSKLPAIDNLACRLGAMLCHDPPQQQHRAKMMTVMTMATTLSSAEIETTTTSPSEAPWWNIGVDLLCYRDSNDGIGWHADDTQEEEIILCLIVSADCTRTLCIQPKNGVNAEIPQRADGPEQVELYPAPGDCYVMDAEMQKHYVHAILQSPTSSATATATRGHRLALVFRHGLKRTLNSSQRDHSMPLNDWSPRKRIEYHFGDLPQLTLFRCYSRAQLKHLQAHGSDRRGVSGNRMMGCDAIIVKNIDPKRFEDDHIIWLLYAANGQQGAGALHLSYHCQKPVRVFRAIIKPRNRKGLKCFASGPSSSGEQQHRLSLADERSLSCSLSSSSSPNLYRYDGIYFIKSIWKFNDKGMPTYLFVLEWGLCHQGM